MRKWSAPQNIIFYVKIIIYQSGSVGSDAEMGHSALFLISVVNLIVYYSWSVGSDADFFFRNPPVGTRGDKNRSLAPPCMS